MPEQPRARVRVRLTGFSCTFAVSRQLLSRCVMHYALDYNVLTSFARLTVNDRVGYKISSDDADEKVTVDH